MELQEALLESEREFWEGGAEVYLCRLDAECLLGFTEMAGISTREQIIAAIEQGERWREVELEPVDLLRPSEDFVILTYRAEAVRGEDERYRALVSSGYVDRDGEWKLAFHQQTPIPDRGTRTDDLSGR